jgi:hypothetical protein
LDVGKTENIKTLTNIGLCSIAGVLMVMNTEDGFVCGWLWASLKRAGKTDTEVLTLTSRAFIVRHVSAISLNTGFHLPAREVPIFLINRTIPGLLWGIMRMDSGSVLSRQ